MKILLATYWLLPHLGGVWPFMDQLRSRLEARGHEVDVLGNGNDATSSYIHIINKNRSIAKSYFLPLLSAKMEAPGFENLRANQWLHFAELERYTYELAAAYLGLHQYDIIHTQDVISAQAINRVKSKQTPLVAQIHGSVAREVQLYLRNNQIGSDSAVWAYYNALEYNGAMSSDRTIVSTNWVRQILTGDFNVPESHIQVFQYGFDKEGFMARQQIPSSTVKPEGKKVIIFTGRLVEIKGVQFLLAALFQLKQVRRDWVCWIVGEGEKAGELHQQSISLGLQDDVAFMGQRDDVPALLKMSDIFVHSSIIDNQPFSVMEAQMAGKAVLLSTAGGLPEMVEHGKTGLIHAVGDVDTLYHHLNYLLSSDELRRNLGAQAQSWGTQHWSLDLMVDRMLNVYGEVIHERGNPNGVF